MASDGDFQEVQEDNGGYQGTSSMSGAPAESQERDPSTARIIPLDDGTSVASNLDAALEASQPKEPITVVLSEKGWIRAMKGHGLDVRSTKFKEGDSLHLVEEMFTIDKLILMASDGRAG